jgi:ribonuclease P protein component
MLPARNRITKKEDFDTVYRQSRTVSVDNLVLKYRKNNQVYTRIGIVVSAKFSKLAVERNKIKRQIREIFRQKLEKMHVGWDMVVMIRKINGSQTVIKSADLEKMVINILKKANLINLSEK